MYFYLLMNKILLLLSLLLLIIIIIVTFEIGAPLLLSYDFRRRKSYPVKYEHSLSPNTARLRMRDRSLERKNATVRKDL